jgi:hypothetical protein
MTKHYEIGYRKPPKEAQWKKGQSGNPNGRPRRDVNMRALVADLLGQRIVVRKGKTVKRMTRLEHLLHRLFEQALLGDARLIKMVFDEARKDEARADQNPSAFDTAADSDVLQALYRRIAREAAESGEAPSTSTRRDSVTL